jgi:hypothetical protein
MTYMPPSAPGGQFPGAAQSSQFIGVPFTPTNMVQGYDQYGRLGVWVTGPGTYFVPYQGYHSSWNWLWGTPAYTNWFGGLGFGRGWGSRFRYGNGGLAGLLGFGLGSLLFGGGGRRR